MPQGNTELAVIDLTAIDLDTVDGPRLLRLLQAAKGLPLSIEASEQEWDHTTDMGRRLLCGTYLSTGKHHLPTRGER